MAGSRPRGRSSGHVPPPAPDPHDPRELWIRLLLYPTHSLPTALAPVLVGVGLAIHVGVFAPLPALLAFVASWFVHVAGVFTDNHELLRWHPALPEHPELLDAVAGDRLALSTLDAATWLCPAVAAACGAWLVRTGGGVTLAIGIVGVVSAIAYAGGPWPYAPRGLAEPVFFLMFGVVAVAAIRYIQAVSLATLPPAARAVRAVLIHEDTPSLFPWTPRTAMLGMLYAALSGVGLAVSH